MGEIIALALALLSVLIGAYAIYTTVKFAKDYKSDSENQIGSLSNILERADRTVVGLERVEGSITTRSAGLFPAHIRKITEMLQVANKEIYIAAEAGYGATSAAQIYIPYEKTILEKGANGVDVFMIVPDAELMKSQRNTQFPDWATMEKRSGFAKLLRDIEKRLRLDNKIETHEQFFSALEEEESLSRLNLTKYVKMTSVQSLLPFNFWVVDGEFAILAIKSYEDDVFAYAFETRDDKLIEALIASWHHHANGPDAKEI